MAKKRAARGDEGHFDSDLAEGCSRDRQSQVINYAINQGIEAIVQKHPRFRDQVGYITSHIDQKKLREGIEGIYERAQEQMAEGKLKNPADREKYVYEGIANYVASGGAFDDTGREIILKKSLEEKAGSRKWKNPFAKEKSKSESYLDGVMTAFRDLYTMLRSGDYAQRMPELTSAVTTINDMGFLDSAVDVLSHYGLIDNKKYSMLKKGIRKKVEGAEKYATKAIENYTTGQKVAASILGVFGALFLISTFTGITGNVIGGGYGANNIVEFVICVVLVAASFFVLKRKRR
jgi:ribosomal protein L21E